MRQDPEHWPKTPPKQPSKNVLAESELVKNSPMLTHSLVNKSKIEMKEIIDIGRFSSKLKLVRTMAYVFRFVTNLRSQKKHVDQLTVNELERAERYIIKRVQSDYFPEEIAYLHETNKKQAKVPQYVSQFGLCLDENQILRCKSRLHNAQISYQEKNPILINGESHLAKLIIAESHNAVLHNGIAQTVCHIRRKYWIPRARQLVKGFIRRRYVCRKHQGKTYEAPPIPSLPDFRVSESPPFYNTGLDFIGPLFTTKGSKVSKNYILLLTCCSTRAVHLEVCYNLTVQSFYMFFRRFAARRGLPRLLVSDDALTFKTASKEVRKIVRSTEVKDLLVNKGVDWEFITERASWMGGTWERLVQTVKRSIKKVIGHSSLNFEELDTLVTEVEAVVNERPLTYVYDDLEGVAYPLTPAQLIYGRNLATFNDKHFVICSKRDVNPSC